jgi:hypothetical protein
LFIVSGVGPVEKLIGASAALAAIVSMLVRHRGFVPPLSAGLWGAFALLAIASLSWAQSPGPGILGMQTIVGLLLVGVVLSMVRADKTDLTALFCGVVGGGVVASVYALALFAGTGHALFIGESQRPIDHNHFGAALLLPSLCATMAAISSANRWVKTLSALAALTCVSGIGISQSRGAMIAFGVAVVYIVLRSRHRWRLLPWAAAVPVMLAAIPGVVARFNDPSTSDAAGRYEVWHIGFAAFKHHWFAGSGFGTFLESYEAAFLEVSQVSSTAQWIQDSHNIIVQIAVELGVIGLPLIFLAWWCQFRTLRSIGPNGRWADVRVTMEAATIALFTMTLSVDLLQYKYTWLAFYATWIARAAYYSDTARGTSAERFPDSAPSGPVATALPVR